MSFSSNVKLGLLIGISIFLAAVLLVLAYLLAKFCLPRKAKPKQKQEIKQPLISSVSAGAPFDEKLYITQEGRQRPYRSPSASPRPTHDEDIRKLRVGKFEFTPTYYHNRKRLQVVIRRATCYPVYQSLQSVVYLYVVANLLPDLKDFFESEMQQISEDNLIDEMCEFEVPYDEIENRILHFEIHVRDRFSRHLKIKDLKYTLSKREGPEFEEANVEKLDFEECGGLGEALAIRRGSSALPEVLFSLCYMPTSGRLTFVALKGKNLNVQDSDVGDIFLRVSLIQGTRTMKTVQTNTARKTTAPVYNEAFVFQVPVERVKDSQLVIRIITKTTGEGEKVIGKFIIGTTAESNLGRKHWEAMLLSARRPIAQWHTLSDFD